MKKYNDFLNEHKYVSPEANIYEFCENLGMEVNIIKADHQTLVVEFMQNIDPEVKWWNSFLGLLEDFGYNKGYIDKNRYDSYKDFGVLNVPDGYNSFSD